MSHSSYTYILNVVASLGLSSVARSQQCQTASRNSTAEMLAIFVAMQIDKTYLMLLACYRDRMQTDAATRCILRAVNASKMRLWPAAWRGLQCFPDLLAAFSGGKGVAKGGEGKAYGLEGEGVGKKRKGKEREERWKERKDNRGKRMREKGEGSGVNFNRQLRSIPSRPSIISALGSPIDIEPSQLFSQNCGSLIWHLCQKCHIQVIFYNVFTSAAWKEFVTCRS